MIELGLIIAFLIGLAIGLSRKKSEPSKGGISLEIRGSHETDPFNIPVEQRNYYKINPEYTAHPLGGITFEPMGSHDSNPFDEHLTDPFESQDPK